MSVPPRSMAPAVGSTPGLLHMAEPAWKNSNVFLGADGKPGIWSFWQAHPPAQGFFGICPYTDQGTSYPTDLSFSGNTIHPATP